jgi:hypothetical protein
VSVTIFTNSASLFNSKYECELVDVKGEIEVDDGIGTSPNTKSRGSVDR